MKMNQTAKLFLIFVKKINVFLGILSGILLFIMTCTVFYSVLMRYCFRKPPLWTTETSTFMLFFIIFVPLGFVLQTNKHMTVDLFTLRIKKETFKWLDICYNIMAATLFTLLFGQALRLVMKAFQLDWLSMEMGIPLGYPYLILPLGYGIMVISCLSKIIGGVIKQ